jgi:hypothetical protein
MQHADSLYVHAIIIIKFLRLLVAHFQLTERRVFCSAVCNSFFFISA